MARVRTAVLLLLTALVFGLHPAGADDPLPPPAGDPPPQQPQPPPEEPPPPPPPQFPPLPEGSGSGRRVVYSVPQQRVWLVEGDERVSASYLVSGRRSLPKPGTYEVFSRSPWSRSGSVRMQYMIRFAKGRTKAMGFHAIPVNRRGRPVQSESELGQPRSKGCVRQKNSDAAHLWDWAPIGTRVVVTGS